MSVRRSMQYVYCFVKGAEEGAVFPRGLGRKKVRLVSFAGIGAVVSEGSPARVSKEMENVLTHQEVVNWALELSRSVIPCRFGVWVTDEAVVITLLGKNTSRLETHFARLAGKVEVEIKAILNAQQSESTMPPGKLTVGERYLLAKREKYPGMKSLSEQGKKLCQTLNKSTTPFWTTVKVEETSFRQKLILRLFYLVERDQVDFFKSAYEESSQNILHCKLLYSGPWPPYSFADVTLS